MRILLLGNNWVGLQVADWLKQQPDEEIVGLVIHPIARRRYGGEIVESVDLPASRIFDGSRLRQPQVAEQVSQLKADIALSVFFGYILRPDFIDLFPQGVINLHASFLPYNRGAHPNVWSIVDGTPAGASLHYVDTGIDTGDIIARKEVSIEPTDTGASLYRKLEDTALKLLTYTWPLLCSGSVPRLPQDPIEGSYHRVRAIESIDEIDLDQDYRARDLINILRARTFPPYPGAYFRSGDRKVFLRLELLTEEDLRRDSDGTES